VNMSTEHQKIYHFQPNFVHILYSLNTCTRLPNGSSILTAEIKAITEALKVVQAKPRLSKNISSSRTQSRLYRWFLKVCLP
jgi:hypothetical protein